MKRGEITGHLYDVHKSDIGMPMRSEAILKRNDRKNISHIDNMIDITNPEYQNRNQTQTFDYFDPYMSSYASEAIQQPRQDVSKQLLSDRLHIDASLHKKNNMDSDMPDIRRSNEIHNISFGDTEYLNEITINMFNFYSNNTINSFCIFPIGVMATLINNDVNINKILSELNKCPIYYTARYYPDKRMICSRTNATFEHISDDFLCYQNNDIILIEFQTGIENFSIGFIKHKNDDHIELSSKTFYEYISNLKRVGINIYRPSFVISNTLNITKMLKYLQYIKNSDKSYSQIDIFGVKNDTFIRKTNSVSNVDLSENFLFYIRYKPNNIILHIGRQLN